MPWLSLAVQKSQANRNVPVVAFFTKMSLAVQKSQANRNVAHQVGIGILSLEHAAFIRKHSLSF